MCIKSMNAVGACTTCAVAVLDRLASSEPAVSRPHGPHLVCLLGACTAIRASAAQQLLPGSAGSPALLEASDPLRPQAPQHLCSAHTAMQNTVMEKSSPCITSTCEVRIQPCRIWSWQKSSQCINDSMNLVSREL